MRLQGRPRSATFGLVRAGAQRRHGTAWPLRLAPPREDPPVKSPRFNSLEKCGQQTYAEDAKHLELLSEKNQRKEVCAFGRGDASAAVLLSEVARLGAGRLYATSSASGC